MYITDGSNLYEVIEECCVRNYGRTQGYLSYTLVRNSVTEATRVMGPLEHSLCRAVTSNGA